MCSTYQTLDFLTENYQNLYLTSVLSTEQYNIQNSSVTFHKNVNCL